MFASIRKYKTNSPDELLQRVRSGFVPIISKAPGFVEYIAVIEGTVAASVSVFQNKEGATESHRLAAEWVKGNVASLVSGSPEITEGEAQAFKK
jgi:uncharacterized protein YfdQ (DUF2303 family)